MKKSKWTISYYALICMGIVLAYLTGIIKNHSLILAFPMKSIIDLLKLIMTKGPIFNVIAIAVYVFVCLSPIYLFIYKNKKRGFIFADLILVFLSITLFYSLYISTLGVYTRGIIFGEDFNITVFNVINLSIFLAYIVIDYINSLEKTIKKDFSCQLKKLLHLVNGILLLSIFIGILPTYFNSYKVLEAREIPADIWDLRDENGNPVNPEIKEDFIEELPNDLDNSEIPPEFSAFANREISLSKLSLLLRFIKHILPVLLALAATVLAIRVLDGNDNLDCLIRLCSQGLKLTVLYSSLLNIFTYFVMDKIYDSKFNLEFPIAIILYLGLILTLAYYVKKNRELEEDNQLFI